MSSKEEVNNQKFSNLRSINVANFMGSNNSKKVNLTDRYAQTRQSKNVKRYTARKG